MKPTIVTCNEGCNKQFELSEMSSVKLDDGIEKTYFTCLHCRHEYVAFYTDAVIRKLQEKIRKTLSKTVDPRLGYSSYSRQERTIQKQVQDQREVIAGKMTALKERFETITSK